jgi:hypothetical protein
MPDNQYTIAIVVDPEFGKRVIPIASRIHVWLAGSPSNCDIAKSIWSNNTDKTPSIETGITTFPISENENPEQWCKDILYMVDLHHGVYSHDPPLSALEIYGLSFNEQLRPFFSEYGFTLFVQTDYGFYASKGPL